MAQTLITDKNLSPNFSTITFLISCKGGGPGFSSLKGSPVLGDVLIFIPSVLKYVIKPAS